MWELDLFLVSYLSLFLSCDFFRDSSLYFVHHTIYFPDKCFKQTVVRDNRVAFQKFHLVRGLRNYIGVITKVVSRDDLILQMMSQSEIVLPSRPPDSVIKLFVAYTADLLNRTVTKSDRSEKNRIYLKINFSFSSLF